MIRLIQKQPRLDIPFVQLPEPCRMIPGCSPGKQISQCLSCAERLGSRWRYAARGRGRRCLLLRVARRLRVGAPQSGCWRCRRGRGKVVAVVFQLFHVDFELVRVWLRCRPSFPIVFVFGFQSELVFAGRAVVAGTSRQKCGRGRSIPVRLRVLGSK